MEVDLSRGKRGRVKFRNGEEWWCPVVEGHGDTYLLRYEHGWYMEYSKNGKKLTGGAIISQDGTWTFPPPNHERDVIEFEPGIFPELPQGCPP